MVVRLRLLIAGLRCWLPLREAHAATLPTEGWTRAANGRLPGARPPRTCWLHLDVS